MALSDTFLTKAQRKAVAGRFTTDELELRYRDMMRGLFIYDGDGLPDDLPYGWLESTALWYASGMAFKDVPGLGFCAFGANPVYVSIYGTPVKWLPANVWGMSANEASKSIGIFKESDTPVMWNGASQRERIRPWMDVLRRSLNTLMTNLASLNHPVIIQGVPSAVKGDNIASVMLESELDDGASFIPTIRPGDPLGLTAIDLGVSDNTANLISTCEYADSQIRAVLGLDTGVNKSSGVGPWDSDSTVGMSGINNSGLELRQEWLERVNETFGTSITVRLNTDAIQAVKADDPMESESNGNDDDDTEESDAQS